MTGTELRWCTIDGTTWTASFGTMQFEIQAVEAWDDVFIFEACGPRSDDNSIDHYGAYKTIDEAKKACMEIIK